MPSLKYSEFMDEINKYGKDWPTNPTEIEATRFVPEYAQRTAGEDERARQFIVWNTIVATALVIGFLVWLGTKRMVKVALGDQERTKIEAQLSFKELCV